MTVSTTSSIAEFDTNGVTTNYPFYFKFLANEDLVVTYVDPLGVSSVLTLGTHYIVNGASNEQGGSIVTTTALAGPGQLIVSREMEAFQQTSLRNQGKFLAETHEDVFDKLTMLIQQGFSIFSRALTRPFGRDYFFAENRRIASLRDPLETQDAATMGWSKRFFSDLVDGVTGAINTTTGIFYDSGTLFDHLRFGVFRSVDSVAAIRLLSSARNQRAFALGYTTRNDAGGGEYYVDPLDTTSLDNGGSVLIGVDGARWKLITHDRAVTPEQFGAFTTSPNCTARLQAILDAGLTIYGAGGIYKVSTLRLPSNTTIKRIGLESIGWAGDPAEPASRQPVIEIDGRSSPKKNFVFEDVHVNGRRDLFDRITFYFGEDGAMHAWRVIGDVENIHGKRCSGKNAGTAGICTHHDSPSATVTEYKLRNIVWEDSDFSDNREHGWFGDSLQDVKFIRCKFRGNGLDIDATKPVEHGLRGATVGGKYFGGPIDIEGYAPGSGVDGVLIKDCDCRFNAGGVLIYDPTPTNAEGFVSRGRIRIEGGYFDPGSTAAVDWIDPDGKFPIKVKGNFVSGPHAYSSIGIFDAYIEGPLYFNGISTLNVTGGLISSIEKCAYVYKVDYLSITAPCLNQKIDFGPYPIPGQMAFVKTVGNAGATLSVTQEFVRCLPDGSFEIYVSGTLAGGTTGAVIYRVDTPSGMLAKSIQVNARRADNSIPVAAQADVFTSGGPSVLVFDASSGANLQVRATIIVTPRLG